jgi:hypothetical protein
VQEFCRQFGANHAGLDLLCCQELFSFGQWFQQPWIVESLSADLNLNMLKDTYDCSRFFFLARLD